MIVLGLLSFGPIAVSLAVLPFVLALLVRGDDGPLLGALVGLGAAAAVTAYVIAIVYALEAFRNPRVSEDMRAAWLVLLILLNAWAIPVYWYRHIRPSARGA